MSIENQVVDSCLYFSVSDRSNIGFIYVIFFMKPIFFEILFHVDGHLDIEFEDIFLA